jgi:acid phosphatase (class A)
MISSSSRRSGVRPLLAASALATGLAAPFTARAEAPSGSAVVLNPDPLSRVVGLPPAPGSAVAKEDLVILLWLQGARTPEMAANTWLLLERNLGTFSRALGVDVVKTTPQINAALKTFLKPVDAVKDTLKDRYQRPRPFVSHAQIQPCLPLEQGYSFPSGHATWYRAASELLADLVPERRERLVCITPVMCKPVSAWVWLQQCKCFRARNGRPSRPILL